MIYTNCPPLTDFTVGRSPTKITFIFYAFMPTCFNIHDFDMSYTTPLVSLNPGQSYTTSPEGSEI